MRNENCKCFNILNKLFFSAVGVRCNYLCTFRIQPKKLKMADNPFNDFADLGEATLSPSRPNYCLIINSVLFLIYFFILSFCREKATEALLGQIQTRLGVICFGVFGSILLLTSLTCCVLHSARQS